MGCQRSIHRGLPGVAAVCGGRWKDRSGGEARLESLQGPPFRATSCASVMLKEFGWTEAEFHEGILNSRGAPCWGLGARNTRKRSRNWAPGEQLLHHECAVVVAFMVAMVASM